MNENKKKKIVNDYLKNKMKQKMRKIDLTERTVGIATQLEITCPSCNRTVHTECERGMHKKEKERYSANETFALNIMLVLGLQQIGGGCSDAMKLLTF